MLLWTAPPECNHTPMVCEKEVGTYYKVLRLLTYTVPYIGIQLNSHMSRYNIHSNYKRTITDNLAPTINHKIFLLPSLTNTIQNHQYENTIKLRQYLAYYKLQPPNALSWQHANTKTSPHLYFISECTLN